MSVRERACQNRFLDMKEKEIKYKSHLNLVKTCKSGIDMKQPEMCRRLKLMKRNNTIFRERTIRNGAMHDKMIDEVRRKEKPLSSLSEIDSTLQYPITRPKTISSLGKTSEIDLFRKQYQATKQRARKEKTQNYAEYQDEPKIILCEQSKKYPMRTGSSSHEMESIEIGTVEKEDEEKIVVVKARKDESQPSVLLISEKSADE